MHTEGVTFYWLVISCVSTKTAYVNITCVQSVLRYKYLILDICHRDTVFYVIDVAFRSQKGAPRTKKVSKALLYKENSLFLGLHMST